ncbi:hypothetical protein [Elizabethkingia sp. M8]|uniref:hypothetical protein n=1 Tax=Elizabethkingia sp. M8 TaxID=2796140 RepID=UPI001908833F|nr:hypothetical protein [Elizabethkingia sp. M8]QQM26601.1 hypothetical protein JCR23_17445 [Elizabethkingia sp. M8]
MVIISCKKTFEIDLKKFLVHTDSFIIQKNPENESPVKEWKEELGSFINLQIESRFNFDW